MIYILCITYYFGTTAITFFEPLPNDLLEYCQQEGIKRTHISKNISFKCMLGKKENWK